MQRNTTAKHNTTAKFLLLFILVISTLLAVTSCGYLKERELEKIRKEAEPLEAELRRLEREVDELEIYIESLAGTGATMATVIIGADASTYTEIYPVFTAVNDRIAKAVLEKLGVVEEDNGDEGDVPDAPTELPPDFIDYRMAGTVAFSREELPGGEGKLTPEQLEELMQEGWTTAIYLNRAAAEDLDAYLTYMEGEYDRLGIPRTSTVCFDIGLYLPKYEEILLAHGIECFIETLDEGSNILSTDLDATLWRVRADGWSGRDGSAVAAYRDLLRSNGASAFIIRPRHTQHRESADDYRIGVDYLYLENMLDTFLPDIVAGDICVASALSAKVRYSEYLVRLELYEETYHGELVPLLQRIEDIKAKLNELYYGNIG